MKIEKESLDPKVLAAFDEENFDEDQRMDDDEWSQMLNHGYVAVYVARAKDKEVAAILVLKTSSVDTGAWYFYSVAVREKYRKMRLAQGIFHHAIAAEIAFGVIVSHCHVDNAASIALHKSLGFKPAGYVPDFYGDFKDAIQWERPR